MMRRAFHLHIHQAPEDPSSLRYTLTRTLWATGKSTQSATLADGQALFVPSADDTLGVGMAALRVALQHIDHERYQRRCEAEARENRLT